MKEIFNAYVLWQCILFGRFKCIGGSKGQWDLNFWEVWKHEKYSCGPSRYFRLLISPESWILKFSSPCKRATNKKPDVCLIHTRKGCNFTSAVSPTAYLSIFSLRWHKPRSLRRGQSYWLLFLFFFNKKRKKDPWEIILNHFTRKPFCYSHRKGIINPSTLALN